MTSLRQRMIEDMQLGNFAPTAQRSYFHFVSASPAGHAPGVSRGQKALARHAYPKSASHFSGAQTPGSAFAQNPVKIQPRNHG